MVFNSFVFFVFFAVVMALYRGLHHRAQNWMLLAASYFFYGWWDYRFLFLMLFSTVADFYLGQMVEDSRTPAVRKRLIAASVAINLGFLGFFKYYNFFSRELNDMLMSLGFNDSLPALNIILPVGISFYTFQSMSYVIDVYRGHTPASRHLPDFALYVAFFPQLVAGPIERSTSLLGQVTTPRTVSRTDVAEGAYLILYGLFKKVVVADNMATIANYAFSRPASELDASIVLLGVYAFAFQIYGDFSGYSNIAQGTARLMGFQLSWNFRIPYLANSPSDFWKRWHISLSTWLRDYLYIPLGGNRANPSRTQINLATTMLLGGLWHGASWTFLWWGALHGLLLIVYRYLPFGKSEIQYQNSLSPNHVSGFTWRGIVPVVVFFHLVCLSWLLFRAESMTQVLTMLGSFANGISVGPFVQYAFATILLLAGPVFVYEFWLDHRGDQFALLRTGLLRQSAAFATMAGGIVFLSSPVPQAFIYFQF